jgi:hypothetical protein
MVPVLEARPAVLAASAPAGTGHGHHGSAFSPLFAIALLTVPPVSAADAGGVLSR